MIDLLHRLRERKLGQWALAYLAGGWVLLQGLDLIGHQFGWPDGLLRGITVALGVGFFATLVLAWYHGERGVQKISGTELLILALLLAIGGGLLWRFARNNEHMLPANIAGKPVLIPAKSIAVLPFVDMSPGHDQDYFSDGMAEEILNALAQVKDLKVAGRTSSFYFKGRNEDLRTIGQTLGVAYILEGSVRKQGDKVRITAQLIHATDDFHLWSESYDGDLSDVFQLQEKIARAIADQLKAILQGKQKTRLVDTGTSNTEAYSLYLQATAIFNRRDGDRFAEAIAALQSAIRLDPTYARAHSRLAALYAVLPSYTDANVSEIHAKVVQYAQSASALDPTLAEPYAALGFSDQKFAGRMDEGFRTFERALQLDPDDVNSNFWFGLGLLKADYRERGLARIDHALAIDPMYPNIVRWRGVIYLYAGDTQRAETMFRRARDLGLQTADYELSRIAGLRHDNATAAKLWYSATQATFRGVSPQEREQISAGVYGDAAARQRALAIVDAYLAQPSEHISQVIPEALLALGQPARALEVMHQRQLTDTTNPFIALWSPQGRAIRALPEFDAFLRDFGFVELWDTYGAPDNCRKNYKGNYVCE